LITLSYKKIKQFTTIKIKMQSSLNIEPIKIKIADIYKYSQVAYLVDRDDFLKDIVKTRKLLKLKDLIPRKDFELIEEVQTDYVNNLFELKISIDKSPEYKRRANIFKKKLEIENFLSLIFKKYKIADDLSNIVVYSILCNEVWDKDLNIGASFFPGDEIINYSDQPLFSKHAGFIAVFPSTKIENVNQIFRDYKRSLKIPDIITNIKRDRKWYWLKKAGWSYSKIFEKAKSEGEYITRDGVIKAIKQYEKRLTMEI
jgi:hypothetical protein